MSTQNEYREETKERVREPKKYSVVMINDDFTTMEFVVNILETIFNKDKASAEAALRILADNLDI